MGLIVTTTAALSIWVVLWSLGTKGFDAFMVAIVVILLGIAGRMIARHLPGAANRGS